MTKKQFYDIGDEKSKIEVKINYRIIKLFSEGLYTSPNKAIEELVSNAFDAGARNAHVILSPDLVAKDSTIVVVDDGTGMDNKDLEKHWVIGVSNKRNDSGIANGRKQIGKFGIGKLATFVLAERLTHICKRKGHYYSTSMDFSRIPANDIYGAASNNGWANVEVVNDPNNQSNPVIAAESTRRKRHRCLFC